MLHDTDGLHLDREREGRVRTVSQGVRQAHQVEYRVREILPSTEEKEPED